MTNLNARMRIGRSLVLVVGLLLSACDGGIFGTGGPDDINMNSADASVPITDGQIGDTGGASVGETDGGTDSTANGVGQEASDAGSTGDTAGTTDGATSTDGAADAGSTDGGSGMDAPLLSTSQFTNNQATLDTANISVNLINTASIPVNAIETAVANSPVLFGSDGVAVNTLSNTATLQQNSTSINIIDNGTQPEIVFSFTSFNASDATFTTLLVRENAGQIDTVPLVTVTKTSDATLAKVRVVQADALSDANAGAIFQLQSAGLNPGGIDESFGPLSFVAPASDYTDVPNGDYELIDSLGRIESQLVSFVGGNVYTIIVLDNSAQPILLVNDTENGG